MKYRIADYFRGVLIFVIFVTSPGVTKSCTHEVFHLCYKLLVLLLTYGSVSLLRPDDSAPHPQGPPSKLC